MEPAAGIPVGWRRAGLDCRRLPRLQPDDAEPRPAWWRTSDHLTPAQKAVSGLVPGYFDGHGWGFGVAVVTRRQDVAAPVGSYGWDGGLGTSWRSDPGEDMVTILLTQASWTSPVPPRVSRDFRTAAYQAIDD